MQRQKHGDDGQAAGQRQPQQGESRHPAHRRAGGAVMVAGMVMAAGMVGVVAMRVVVVGRVVEGGLMTAGVVMPGVCLSGVRVTSVFMARGMLVSGIPRLLMVSEILRTLILGMLILEALTFSAISSGAGTLKARGRIGAVSPLRDGGIGGWNAAGGVEQGHLP